MVSKKQLTHYEVVQMKFKAFCKKIELGECCSEKTLKILRLAGEGSHYQKQIASALGLPKTTVFLPY